MTELDEGFNIFKEFDSESSALAVNLAKKNSGLDIDEIFHIYSMATAAAIIRMLEQFQTEADDEVEIKNIILNTVDKICSRISLAAKILMIEDVNVFKDGS
jgi:hypothetical protein